MGWAWILAIVAKTEEGLYIASQWEPSVFIEVFKKGPDEIGQATALNKEFGFPPPANLLSTHDMEVYFADNIWLDENGRVCEGVPNDFVSTCYANDIEAIQTFFGLLVNSVSK